MLTYGHSANAAIRAGDFTLGAESTQLTVIAPDGSVSLLLPLIGRHNISNALAAYSIVSAMGVDGRIIGKALADVPSVPGRLEPVPNGRGLTVLVAYAHTPAALEVVLGADLRLNSTARGQ